MDTVYAGMAVEPEAGFDYAVGFVSCAAVTELNSLQTEKWCSLVHRFDCDACQDPEGVLKKVSTIRRHVLGAPFTRVRYSWIG